MSKPEREILFSTPLDSAGQPGDLHDEMLDSKVPDTRVDFVDPFIKIRERISKENKGRGYEFYIGWMITILCFFILFKTILNKVI